MKGIHARYGAYLVAQRHTDTVIKSVRNTTTIHNYTNVVVLKWIHKTLTALLGRRSSNSPRSSTGAKDANKRRKAKSLGLDAMCKLIHSTETVRGHYCI
jgi:hypothetical protein